MANFTMEVREMMNQPLINGVFTFDYEFYSDNLKDKETFEKLFISHFYFREIGFETPERFKVKLQSKLNIIMPYYRQLALTEWNKVRSTEQMMTSKNLKETTEHKQSIEGTNENESQSNSSNQQSDTISQSSTSTGTSGTSSSGTNSTSSSTHDKQSSLADGVSQASLSDGYLTSVGESSNSTTGQSSNNTNVTMNTSDTTDTDYNASIKDGYYLMYFLPFWMSRPLLAARPPML